MAQCGIENKTFIQDLVNLKIVVSPFGVNVRITFLPSTSYYDVPLIKFNINVYIFTLFVSYINL